MYVNEDVRWGLVAVRFFAAPTPILPHGGGSRTAGDFALAVCRRTPPRPSTGRGGKSAGGRAAVVVFDGRRCVKAHPVVLGMGNAAVLRRIVEGFEQGLHALSFEFFLDADGLVFAGVGADEDEVVFVFAVDDFDR